MANVPRHNPEQLDLIHYEPGEEVSPADWREYVWRRASRPAPERMTDGLPGQFSPFESGYDPADPVDRAIMATRNVTFPLHGLMPVP